MNTFRTDVENLFLSEMVEEDMDLIIAEEAVDDIIPTNTVGLFDDTTSKDSVDDITDDSDINIF